MWIMFHAAFSFLRKTFKMDPQPSTNDYLPESPTDV